MKHQGPKRLTWRCTKERSLECSGTIYTDLEIGHSQIGKVHSHIADKHEVNNIFIIKYRILHYIQYYNIHAVNECIQKSLLD